MLKTISRLLIFFGAEFSLSVNAQDSAFVTSDALKAKAILSGENEQARQQWLRRQLFVENILTHRAVSASDSSLRFRIESQSPLSLSQSQLKAIPPRLDQIDEKFRREQLGLPPMSNIGDLIGKGVQYLAEKLGGGTDKDPLAVIPSEVEIDIMKVLWKKNAATSAEIYADLDSVDLTALDLQQTLAVMADRGLVDRQQISPRHEFTILGAIPLEISTQNRKNREFLYRPQVTRQTMLTFLDATTFSYRLALTNNHSIFVEHLRSLMRKLVVDEY
jgi:predicted transcriptional regulator